MAQQDDRLKTLWEREEFGKASPTYRYIRTLREQLIQSEAENRVKYANGKALKYYVYGRPKSGGVVITKDEQGFNTVTDRALLGVFDTEEEAMAFNDALNRNIEQNG